MPQAQVDTGIISRINVHATNNRYNSIDYTTVDEYNDFRKFWTLLISGGSVCELWYFLHSSIKLIDFIWRQAKELVKPVTKK